MNLAPIGGLPTRGERGILGVGMKETAPGRTSEVRQANARGQVAGMTRSSSVNTSYDKAVMELVHKQRHRRNFASACRRKDNSGQAKRRMNLFLLTGVTLVAVSKVVVTILSVC